MNWTERLLEAIVEQRGIVDIRQGGKTVTRGELGPVTLPSGDTRTAMLGSSKEKKKKAAKTRKALRRGPITATTVTTTADNPADESPENITTKRTRITPELAKHPQGRRTVQTTKRGTKPARTTVTQRKPTQKDDDED